MPLDDFEVGSPEWEAEVERLDAEELAQREAAALADGEKTDDKEGNPTPDPDAEVEKPAAEVKPTETPAPPPPAEDKPEPEKLETPPAGVMSKDGKTVLPYAALKGARKQAFEAKQLADQERQGREAAEARASAAEQLLADIKAGKVPVGDDAPTEKELKELEQYAPKTAEAYKKAVARANAAEAKVVEVTKAAPKPAAPAVDDDNPEQEAIDQIPLLAGWEAEGGAEWKRAVAHDQVLRTSPKWAGKPLLERFKHVTKLVAEEFDIPLQGEAPPPPPPPPTTKPGKADPKKAIEAAKLTAPQTLSDFKGGGTDQNDDKPLERMAPLSQLARVQDMTPAEFELYLAKLG